ncbi:MAG: CPBP family intramembrane metalloprotease [Lachnospiraceae bacterium]|nr:CPBP family intramembrane metalloprotease [Lachnospiraceae bacterium]
MVKKTKCICESFLITLSFVLFIGIVSSVIIMNIQNALEYMALISGMAQLLYLILVIILLKIKGVAIQDRCQVRPVSYKKYILPAVAAFSFSAFSNIIQVNIPIPEALTGDMENHLGNSIVAFIMSVFIIAPIVEEVVFRGLIMTKLRKEMSVTTSSLLSAVLFAIIHFMAGGTITVIHAFWGGLIFALVYEKTKSLLPAIAAHSFGNIGGFVPQAIHSCPAIIQYMIGVVFMIVAILSCAFLKSNANKKMPNVSRSLKS